MTRRWAVGELSQTESNSRWVFGLVARRGAGGRWRGEAQVFRAGLRIPNADYKNVVGRNRRAAATFKIRLPATTIEEGAGESPAGAPRAPGYCSVKFTVTVMITGTA